MSDLDPIARLQAIKDDLLGALCPREGESGPCPCYGCQDCQWILRKHFGVTDGEILTAHHAKWAKAHE